MAGDPSGERDRNGRFAPGNAGGPGRPRRAVEQEYLAVLSDELPVSRWRKIAQKAIEDAENGDWRAREWLAKYVLGPDPRVDVISYRGALRLFELVVEEAKGHTVDDRVEGRLATDRISGPSLEELLAGGSG